MATNYVREICKLHNYFVKNLSFSLYSRRELHFWNSTRTLLTFAGADKHFFRRCIKNFVLVRKGARHSSRLFPISLGAFQPLVRLTQCRQKVSNRTEQHVRKKRLNSVVESPSASWRELFSLIKPYLHWLLAAALAAGFVAALNIQIPIILGQMVNKIYCFLNRNDADTGPLFGLAELKPTMYKLISAYLAQAFGTFLCILSLSQMGERMSADLRVRLFSHLLEMPMPFFDAQRSGELSDRLNYDVQQFKSSFKECTAQGLRTTAQTIGCVISMYMLSPEMTVLTLGIVPAIVGVGAFGGALLRRLSARAQAQGGEVAGVAAEAFQNIRTVKVFAMEDAESDLYQSEVKKAKKLNERLGLGIGLFQAGSNLFLNGLVLGVLYGGGQLVVSHVLSPGDLMAFLATAQTIQRSLAQLSLVFGSGIKVWASCGRIMEILRLDPSYGKGGTEKIAAHSFIGDIQLNDVHFVYPTRPGHKVLKGLDMHIGNGQIVAICGASGAGKSTVAALIERIYEPVGGSLTLDGVDLRKLDPKWLRKNVIGVISQEPVLFSTSIRENIRYGNVEASENEIREAAKLANADQFIEQFPQGYDTVVGERGVTLSGGQKQRIAIARALLKKSPILVMDEATSALDTESERLIHQALNRALRDRTVIIIAHRLSTIRNADCIYVLEEGRVAEKGTHSQLIKNRFGIYYKLVREQEQLRSVEEREQEGGVI